jgi:hypothetical protein
MAAMYSFSERAMIALPELLVGLIMQENAGGPIPLNLVCSPQDTDRWSRCTSTEPK